jgi:hypothetical protein
VEDGLRGVEEDEEDEEARTADVLATGVTGVQEVPLIDREARMTAILDRSVRSSSSEEEVDSILLIRMKVNSFEGAKRMTIDYEFVAFWRVGES